MPQELKVIADFYDFMLWLIRHTEKFPRHHRYSMGVAMENRLQDILKLLLRAKYSKQKAGFLNDANIELEVLRFQLRLGHGCGGDADQEPRARRRSSAKDRGADWRLAGQQGGRRVKRCGGLWEKVIAWENLRLAARKAHRGKRDRAGVQRLRVRLGKQSPRPAPGTG